MTLQELRRMDAQLLNYMLSQRMFNSGHKAFASSAFEHGMGFLIMYSPVIQAWIAEKMQEAEASPKES